MPGAGCLATDTPALDASAGGRPAECACQCAEPREELAFAGHLSIYMPYLADPGDMLPYLGLLWRDGLDRERAASPCRGLPMRPDEVLGSPGLGEGSFGRGNGI
ncbi:hypothetical protein NDU88_008270 [Pleurodeles waltl]|uniref:Uncharacterized protein n=1 Tax=Pleurodeles waltl TaxID=8319 RepID=A0AAV7QN14_PLEWA|nr:hypothetical protein NDU88_008270 [Pleurodeles waltl]